jgi:D-glycero-D-manno-heptose 1,7-bisphosphate phosphatase
MMRLVILDRDGVINQDSDAYIKCADEWVPIPGSLEAMARLYHGGFRLAIASNQSGVARRLFTIDDLNAIHRKMYRELSVLGAQVEAVFFCPHAPEQDCRCRKPRWGLLEDIGARFQLDLTGVPCVGDSYRDLVAARAVGAVPILVRTGKGERTLRAYENELADVAVFPDLAAFADALLGGA